MKLLFMVNYTEEDIFTNPRVETLGPPTAVGISRAQVIIGLAFS